LSKETYKALIEALVTQRSSTLGSSKADAFLSLVTELLVQEYDLSLDEMDTGITDGSGDGQIDAMYVLVNGALLNGEEIDGIPDKGPLEIDIVLVQAKFTDGFEENILKIIRTTVGDLFDLGRLYAQPLPQYSEALQDLFANARRALLASAGRTAKIKVRVYYASKAPTAGIHNSVRETAKLLKAELSAKTATSDVEIEFFGAQELITLTRLPKTRTRSLSSHAVISSDSGDSLVCLVTIGALIQFLTDDKDQLIRSLFDANVRAFLGQAEVTRFW
jgi:hypothetical protein